MSEWIGNKLQDVTIFIKDGTHGTHKDVQDGIPLLSAKDIENGKINLPDNCRKISEIDYKKLHANYEIENEDILLTVVGTIGRVAIAKKLSRKITFQRSVSIIRFDKSKIFPDYSFHYFQSNKFQQALERSKNASAQGGVYLGELAKIKLYHPAKFDEQQRISKILTTCDTVIEQTQAAIAKYKAIKQGMLHDLFTRGVDTKGKLRPTFQQAPELYKESELGMIPKEWEVKRLDTLSENFDGKRRPVKQEDRDYKAKIYPYYGASGIIDYVDAYLFDEELILLGEDGENVLSRNLPLAFKVKGKIWVNNHAHVLKPYSFMNIEYLTAALELIDYTPVVSGSAQPKITQKELNKLFVKKPLKEEQIQIAKLITTYNNKLQSEVTLLSKYQSIKRGLMGDLLSGKKEV